MSDNIKDEPKYYYHVKDQLGRERTIGVNRVLRDGRTYNLPDGTPITVIKRAHFKYKFSDLKVLYDLLEGYSIGSLQYHFRLRLGNILNNECPKIRFSSDERAMLLDIYYDEPTLTTKDKEVLEKVLK